MKFSPYLAGTTRWEQCIRGKLVRGLSICLFVMATLAGGRAQAEVAEIKVPKAALGVAINSALSSMKVRIDNFGKKRGTTWLANDSYIALPTGQKVKFSIPEYKFKTAHLRYVKEYLDELESTHLKTSVIGSRLESTLFFESQGNEIRGRCVRRLFGKWRECSLNMNRDINLDNTMLKVSGVPIAHAGGISLGQLKVSFNSDIRIASRLCQAFGGICSWIENKIYKGVKSTVERTATSHLSVDAVKDHIAKAVRNNATIRRLLDPRWKVRSVVSRGSNFVVTVERPDQINASSVQRVAISAKRSSPSQSCPAKVQFTATMRAKHHVRGKGWLEHEDGSKSREFKWNARKNRQESSEVSRTMKNRGEGPHRGWTRMVVQWQGSDGKNHTKRSGRAAYSVQCKRPLANSMSR